MWFANSQFNRHSNSRQFAIMLCNRNWNSWQWTENWCHGRGSSEQFAKIWLVWCIGERLMVWQRRTRIRAWCYRAEMDGVRLGLAKSYLLLFPSLLNGLKKNQVSTGTLALALQISFSSARQCIVFVSPSAGLSGPLMKPMFVISWLA